VPRWIALPTELVVIWSELGELALGGTLITLPRYRTKAGWIATVCLVA
jgi:hypothetical protein